MANTQFKKGLIPWNKGKKGVMPIPWNKGLSKDDPRVAANLKGLLQVAKAKRVRRIKKKCPVCEEYFISKETQDQKNCSLKCTGIAKVRQTKRVTRKCKYCRKYFKILESDFKIGSKKGLFCSGKCSLQYKKSTTLKRNCPLCGKQIKVQLSRIKKGKRRYCSRSCFNKSQTKKVARICQYCRKHFEVVPGELKKGGGKFCSLKCKYKMAKGSNHYNWKGGKSFEPYTIEFNRQLKELIRQRDNHQCQKCRMSEIENMEKLSIHHVDYNKKNCLPSNLIALCRRCNSVVNHNRQYWEKYFLSLARKFGRQSRTIIIERRN